MTATLIREFADEVQSRVEQIAAMAEAGGLDQAIAC